MQVMQTFRKESILGPMAGNFRKMLRSQIYKQTSKEIDVVEAVHEKHKYSVKKVNLGKLNRTNKSMRYR